MGVDSVWRTIASDARARTLERRWEKLCALYLPIAPPDSVWNYRQETDDNLPEAGWKLHVSATILNATRILERIAPFLIETRIQFKAARSLTDIQRLNSGLLHTYSQVGKVITVYPRDDDEAVFLAYELHRLTHRFKCPSVPFDLRLARTSNVYYRYGAFRKVEIEQADGRRLLMMPSPSGELVPDVRENPKPDWVRDPFQSSKPVARTRKNDRKAATPFHVLRALVQRGKGGVYQAIDFQSNPPRLCLLKEGRKHGELTWDGRDGAWRVRNEERVLSRLLKHGLEVPRVYSRFELEGNFYLVMEFVDGESLHDLLFKQRRRLPINRVLSIGGQVATFLSQMHRAGWAWRDCKPKNLIVNREGTLVPIDFEGAERIDRPDSLLWGTPGFVPVVSRKDAAQTGMTDDLYALGSVLYLLVTGRVYNPSEPVTIQKLRRRVPTELRRLVEVLLQDDAAKRPSAQTACTQLTSISLKCSTHYLREHAKAA